jgi:hypothetical protein
MTRTHFINVWNEAIHEQFFGASYENINHLFVSFVPKNNGEKALMQDEIAQLIARMDSLYSNGRTKFIEHEERPFKIFIASLFASMMLKRLQSKSRLYCLVTMGKSKLHQVIISQMALTHRKLAS